MHYGVKGMRWGFSKQKINADYTPKQRDRDKALYGRGGVRRINKRLNDGGSLTGSRSREVARRNEVVSRNFYLRNGGNIVGTAKGQNAMAKVIGSNGAMQVNNILNRSDVGVYAKYILGSAIGSKLVGDAAVSANMTIGGYDPRRHK